MLQDLDIRTGLERELIIGMFSGAMRNAVAASLVAGPADDELLNNATEGFHDYGRSPRQR